VTHPTVSYFSFKLQYHNLCSPTWTGKPPMSRILCANLSKKSSNTMHDVSSRQYCYPYGLYSARFRARPGILPRPSLSVSKVYNHHLAPPGIYALWVLDSALSQLQVIWGPFSARWWYTIKILIKGRRVIDVTGPGGAKLDSAI